MIGTLILGALACYALIRQRTPKQDPTCGGRIVPNGAPAQRDAIREGWRLYWLAHEQSMQECRERLWAAETVQFHRDQAKAQERTNRMMQDIGEYRGQ
jgi:hypothetical protein